MPSDNATPTPDSMRAQIENLDVGETYARASRFDFDSVSKDQLNSAVRGLRFAMNPTVDRLKKRTGYKYLVEEGEVRTQSRDVIILVAVTRLA